MGETLKQVVPINFFSSSSIGINLQTTQNVVIQFFWFMYVFVPVCMFVAWSTDILTTISIGVVPMVNDDQWVMEPVRVFVW
jgi:hypothetical protein